ncbi:isotrichodermin C-15 hydroxylase [Stachybotrys elegans]|uniref:Isotrichodermin C-15 hydroxylase n=1 Tax=Stachybotrys elegans TaxID=80388 RepID=A0A8K0SDN3_9HYPO|nr:isotrichodermin C-15 hydroxylase [Stachybotrys elegans]
MSFLSYFTLFSELLGTKNQYYGPLAATLIAYATARCIYNLYFHPLSKFPGPRMAAVSNAWWAFHWLGGKYPWAIAQALSIYGDVVRIGPNEVVFITPKAAEDIYDSHTRHMEHFTRTDWLDLGEGQNGINWERDPVKHREIRKRLAPAFSVQALNARESVLHKHIDYFLARMQEFGAQKDGIDLRDWTDWLAMDISADMAYSREMKQMETMKNAPLLNSIWAVNFFLAVDAVTRKFRLLAPLKYLFVPPSVLATLPKTLALNHKEVVARISRRGESDHRDYFSHLCPADAPEPSKSELNHMEIVAGQLLSAGYEPISSQFLCTLVFIIQNNESYGWLVDEIRGRFKSSQEITTETVAHMKLLNACLMETLRITVIGANGLPRISPGAIVDGHYINKGITVQYGHFAFTRSPRYFHEPEGFRPQRWLTRDHIHWDESFANDATESFSPFSRGPRNCPGMGSAWRQTRLFIAKVIWAFDVERLPGQEIIFDRDFRSYAMWDKPKIQVRFLPVTRA